MKQFQFEVKNHNNLKKELARVKRFAKNEFYNSVYFQLFTTLEDLEEVEKITDIIDEEFPEGFYYGCQTYGNIYDGNLSKSHTMIVCSFFEFETTESKVIYLDPLDPFSEFQSLQDLWDFTNENEWVRGIELTASYKGAELLGVGKAIENLREDIVVFGGVASNPKSMAIEDTYIFAKNHEPSNTASIAILVGGPDLHTATYMVKGWKGLGKNFVISDCEGKRIRAIDKEPAMNVYKKYYGIEQDENFFSNAIKFPLLVEENGIECIRVPGSCENKDEFNMLTNMEVGKKARLSYGEKNIILKEAKEKVEDIASFAPDSVRVYSCAARRVFWGDDEVGKETSIYDEIAPTIGFYTRGEILRIGNFLHYLNSTIVISLLREGDIYEYDYDLFDSEEEEEISSDIAPQLINYISAVTDELEGQYNSTMKGLANIYKTMFLVDIKDRVLTQLDNDEKTAKYLAEKEGFSDKMKNYLYNTVIDNMQYQARIFCDFHTLKARLRYKNFTDCELISKEYGWFRAQFVVISRDEQNVPVQFVFTTQIIDKEKKASLEQQKIIQALADTYYTLHVFDFDIDRVAEISTDDLLHRVQMENSTNGCQATINAAMEKTCAGEYLEYMLEFVDFSTLDKRLRGHKFLGAEFYGKHKGWAKATLLSLEKDVEGKITKVLFATQLINDEKRKEERLVRRANTDELTGLFNRRSFEDDLDEIRKETSSDNSYVFVAIDVNGLKVANDTLGHQAGDELIVATAQIIERCLGSYGKTYRTGGDEFAAILLNCGDKLSNIKEDLLREVDIWRGSIVESLSLSCGYVESKEFEKADIDEMIKVADKRMYEAKEAHYRAKGVDRRGQKTAYDVLCQSYTKILKVNLTSDTYDIIKAEDSELNESKGYSEDSISKWLLSFANSGQVHESDKGQFIARTDIDYLREYFRMGNKLFSIQYKRMIDDTFKSVIMEMIPSQNFKEENMEVFLYVKNIQGAE